MVMNDWHVAAVSSQVNSNGQYAGWLPCMQWCTRVFDQGADVTGRNVWRYESEGVFLFENEADRTAFLLRWA